MRVNEQMAALKVSGKSGMVYPTLIWDESSLVLVDACFPNQFEALEAAVQQAGFEVSAISHVILTHQDIDHIGCVAEVLEAAPQAKLLCLEAEAKYIDGRETPVKLSQMEASYDNLPEDRQAWYRQLKGWIAQRRFQIDETVTDGEILPICGGVRVIHTPGHTPGHMCLYVQNQKTLIAGDALNIDAEGRLIGPNPVFTQDMALAKQSVAKLKDYEIKTVLSYHGGVFDADVQAALDMIIR